MTFPPVSKIGACWYKKRTKERKAGEVARQDKADAAGNGALLDSRSGGGRSDGLAGRGPDVAAPLTEELGGKGRGAPQLIAHPRFPWRTLQKCVAGGFQPAGERSTCGRKGARSRAMLQVPGKGEGLLPTVFLLG